LGAVARRDPTQARAMSLSEESDDSSVIEVACTFVSPLRNAPHAEADCPDLRAGAAGPRLQPCAHCFCRVCDANVVQCRDRAAHAAHAAGDRAQQLDRLEAGLAAVDVESTADVGRGSVLTAGDDARPGEASVVKIERGARAGGGSAEEESMLQRLERLESAVLQRMDGVEATLHRLSAAVEALKDGNCKCSERSERRGS
jgi:hypothetical protein